MFRLQRGWGFPIALIALWIIAVAYTFSALTGMEATLHSTQAPVQSMSAPVTGRPVATQVRGPVPSESRYG